MLALAIPARSLHVVGIGGRAGGGYPREAVRRSNRQRGRR